MLQPKRTKFRKQFTGRMRGKAYRGSDVSFGDYALQATACGRLSSRQIEAGRMAIQRKVKRQGKLYIRVFPDKPLTNKPLETRMGKGKAEVDYWAARVKPGTILFELAGVSEARARGAFFRVAMKMPVKCRMIGRRVEA